MTEEVRSVSSTGAEKGVKLAMYSAIPSGALLEIAEHYGKGSLKYSKDNWRKGYEWSKSFDALNRHLWQFWNGEDRDEETGSKHIIAVAWHALALATFMDEFPEFDDRFKVELKEVIASVEEARSVSELLNRRSMQAHASGR
nr:dATP/dGTP diphosphohydrolase domain-containing protein [Rhodococcus sp. (in: high G+C Gram-positive bacteria)]